MRIFRSLNINVPSSYGYCCSKALLYLLLHDFGLILQLEEFVVFTNDNNDNDDAAIIAADNNHNNDNNYNYGKDCRMLKGATMIMIVLLMKACIESYRDISFVFFLFWITTTDGI